MDRRDPSSTLRNKQKVKTDTPGWLHVASKQARGRGREDIRETQPYAQGRNNAARPYQRRADAARRSWSPYFLLPYLRWT